MRAEAWGVLVLGLGILAGCAGRPAGSVHTAPDSAADQSPSEAERSRLEEAPSTPGHPGTYDLRSEGEAPVDGDVDFEEDRLPPAPEEVGGDTLETPSVQSEDVESLPEVGPDATERIEPSVTAPVDPSVKPPVPSRPPQIIRGFRVQIAATQDRTRAEELAREARSRVPEPVHVVFESPYYKVRVGDFHDRDLALQMRDRLRAYGYEQAWVVTTEIVASTKEAKP